MESSKFIGWVSHIFDANDFDQNFVVANYKDEESKQELVSMKGYPECRKFTLNVKNGSNAQIDGIHVGDKIQVVFFIHGNQGISKKTGKYFCVNTLNVAKKNGIVILEQVVRAEEREPDAMDADGMDVPF